VVDAVSVIETRIRTYRSFVTLPWAKRLSGAERVWMVIYPPHDERRLRKRVEEFELATKEAGHNWKLVDITPAFAEWMAGQRYREEYFASPDDLSLALANFASTLAGEVRAELEADDVDDETVVALLGSGSLFGLGPARVSKLIEEIEGSIRGRLLIFFPGEKDGNNFRLLDARDGWSYLAIAIDETEETG
jgi:hypothetical protein